MKRESIATGALHGARHVIQRLTARRSQPKQSCPSWHVCWIDRPGTTPTRDEQPGSGERHWPSCPLTRDRAHAPELPAVEPPGRRRGIEACHPRKPLGMPTCVQEHVAKSIPHLARRPQHVRMVPICEHRPAALEHPVHGPRESRSYGLHPTRQRRHVRRLDQQMGMVSLERVVHQAKVPAVAGEREAPLELLHELHGTKRWHVGQNTQRHVRGVPRCEGCPHAMRHARPLTSRLSSRASTPPAPAPLRQEVE